MTVDWPPAMRRRSDAGRSDCGRTNGRPTVAVGEARQVPRPLEMRAADDEAHVDSDRVPVAGRPLLYRETEALPGRCWPFASHSTAAGRRADGTAGLVLARRLAPFC